MAPRKKTTNDTVLPEQGANGSLRPFSGGALRRQIKPVDRKTAELVRVHLNDDEMRKLSLFALAHGLRPGEMIRRLVVLHVPTLVIATRETDEPAAVPAPSPMEPCVTIEQLRQGMGIEPPMADAA
jgi:hypothetical protein